jgi:glutamate-1-semialdehyde 2,1-aminomutase
VAGLVTLRALDGSAFDRLADMGARLRGRLNEVFRKMGVPGHVTGDGSLFKFVMTAAPLSSYRDTMAAGAEERMGKLFMHLLDAGVLVNTNGLACLSTVMTEGDLDTVVDALQQSLSAFA